MNDGKSNLTMSDSDKTRQAMDEVAHELIRLETTDILARISTSRITNELLKQLSISLDAPWQLYCVGSLQEGNPKSATSDVDMMICKTTFPIVMWKSPENERKSYVIAEQHPKNPVYMRLKVVDKQRLDEDYRSIIDNDGYLKTSDFIKANSNNPFYNGEDYNTEMRQGPSIVGKFNSGLEDIKTCPTDSVFCLKCESWPPFTRDFFTRKRQVNWPSQKLLDKVESLECHVVPVGYSGSESYDIEWRLSLSIAERQLLTEMYEPYANCMFVLKLIKKKYIIYSDTDKPTPFCSYFIKTACLWMCETFPHTDYSLMNLIRKVLDWLIECYQQKHLPHYFIPQNNLIGHLSRESCDNVRGTLTSIKSNLWTKVLCVSNSKTHSGCSALNSMFDRLNIAREYGDDDYSTLENTLLNHPEATAEIECMHHSLVTKVEIPKFCDYNFYFYNVHIVLEDHMHARGPLETLGIPEKIIMPIVDNIEETVPTGYEEMMKTSLYRYLGDIYTHLLVVCTKNHGHMYDQALFKYKDTPLYYYGIGGTMTFPDNCSDYGIGGQVLVVKYHYLMGNHDELKKLCDLILLDNCLKEENCRLGSVRITQQKTMYASPRILGGWDADKILHQNVKRFSKAELLCHPIILVLYIKARVLLIEGDTENALNLVKQMRECQDKMQHSTYHETTMFIRIIESLTEKKK